jgi:hypothetical protein
MPSSEVAMRRQEEKNCKVETWLYEEDDDEEVEADEVQHDALKPVEASKPVPLDPGTEEVETYSRLNQIIYSSWSTSSCTSNRV